MKNLEQKVLAWIEDDKQRIIDTCADLVKFNTSSTHGDTRLAMTYIKEFCGRENIEVQEFAACKTMPNLLMTTEMQGSGRHLMLNGHLDTMPAGKEPGWTVKPYSGTVTDGKIIGRGVSDMKAGVTAMLFAYTYLRRLKDNLAGKISLSLVSDEETGWGRGTGYLFEKVPEKMTADCVLSAEPSDVRAINFASKGYIQATVTVKTRGAIAGYSNESPSAIEIAADIIRALKNLEQIKVELSKEIKDFLEQPGYSSNHEKIRGKNYLEQLSRITADVCTIKGGNLQSVISPDCKFTVAVVIPWGTNVDEILDKMKSIAENYPQAELVVDGVDLPDIAATKNEMVDILTDTVTAFTKSAPILTPDIALSDCRYWRQRNIPAYWYGPGGDLCSAADEYVTVEDLLLTVKVHTMAAIRYFVKANL